MRAGLEIQDLAKAFGAKSVLAGVSLSCAAGAVTGLIGRNGSGKTTLLRCVTAQLSHDAGVVRLDGEPLHGEPAWKRARRGIAWTFQDLSMPIEADVTGLRLAARRAAGRRLTAEAAHPTLSNALEPFASQPWRQLSFGQRKLASLAIALERRPVALLLDEPAAGLSDAFRQTALEAIRAHAADGAVVVVIEHNRTFLSGCADEVAVLSKGAIVFKGSPEAAFTDPAVFEALT